MVTTKLNLSMTEPQVRQIYAKQGDTGRVLDISLDQTPEDGTLRILRPDGVEVTSEAVTGGEISESGETVTFESMTEADVTELTVGIEPVQDLNGYDKPWVGGAGANIIGDFDLANNPTSGGEITATRQSDGSTYVLSGTATATRDVYMLSTGSYPLEEGEYSAYAPTGTGINGTANYFYIVIYNGTSARYIGAGGTNSSPSFTIASGEEVRAMFIRVASGVNTNGKVVTPMIVKGTTAPTSYSPYSNICPITGHDEVEVTQTGKNLCPTFTGGTGSGLTYTVNEDGSVHVTGTNAGTTFWAVQLTLPKGTYVLTGAPTNGQLTLRSARGGGAPSSAFSGVLDDYGNGATFTVSETASAWLNIRSTAGTHDKTYYPMIRLASVTDDTYEPYQGSTYTTSLGQTVYGGTLDMVSGKLTLTHEARTFSNLESAFGVQWQYNSTYQTFELNRIVTIPSASGDAWDAKCSCYQTKEYGSNGSYSGVDNIIWAHTSGSLRLRDTRYTTRASFLADVGNEMLYYPLQTPIEIDLTPQQIKTLVGTNNVWASSGDIVSIKFAYGGLLSELPSDATEIVGKCYCDIEQNGVSSMPFTLNVKKNERET